MTWPGGDDEPDPDHSRRVRPFLAAPPLVAGAAADRPTGPPTPADDGSAPPTGLRPFVLTAGRVTGADPAIGIETQVTARPAGPSWAGPPLARLSPESQEIVALCRAPLSVAEISARLRLHLGVTRILVGDLRSTGHLDVHIQDADQPVNPDIILRVIDGLRALS